MVTIWFRYDEMFSVNGVNIRYNNGKSIFYETHRGITFDEVILVAKNMTRCRAPQFEFIWVFEKEFRTVTDQSNWEHILAVCTEQIELVLMPEWGGTKLEDDDDYEQDVVVQYVDNELYELTRHLRGLGLRGGKPEGESSNANVDEGESSNAEPEVGERDDMYSSDSGAEPYEELVNRENRVGDYQFPEQWNSGEWQEGLECNDWEIHAASSSSTSGYFKLKDAFPNKKALQKYVKDWHIDNSRQCKAPRSSTAEILYTCTNKRCSWDLRATSGFCGEWTIVRVGPPHTCVNHEPIKHHKNLDCKLIEEVIYRSVKDNLSITVKYLQNIVKNSRYHEYPTYHKVWYAKCNVIESMYGTHDSAFGRLPQQLLAIKHFNPGSVFDFQYRNPVVGKIAMFDKCLWAFAPSIHGFQHCRPLISIDGTHLYGKYTGKLLIVVAYDADNQIFPLAFCLCDRESTDTWTWFLSHLREHVTKNRVVCIISDRHAGILRAISEVYPYPNAHRSCARHLASNFNHHFKNKKLKERFSNMIYEVNKQKFMNDVSMWRAVDGGKYAGFIDRCGEFNIWSLAFDDGLRYCVMTTNHSECFNKVLKDARMLPVTALVDETFSKMVTYWVDRKNKAEDKVKAKHKFSPKIRQHLKEAENDVKLFRVRTYEQGVLFYVSAPGRDEDYTVNLLERECDCGRWRLFRRPCCHAVAAVGHANGRVRDFVSPWFTNKMCIDTYSMSFKTLRQKSDWPIWDGPSVIADPKMLIVDRGRKKKFPMKWTQAKHPSGVDAVNVVKKVTTQEVVTVRPKRSSIRLFGTSCN